MKRIAILASAILLAGCSSFKLGGMVYCPFGAACSFQMLSPGVAPVVGPAASGVSV